MRILLTNDDGIYADGISVLGEAMAELGEVYVAAPAFEQSGMGHSISSQRPIRAEEVFLPYAKTAWKIDGTPTDCVKLGVEGLLDAPPDLLISGINDGPNLGTDVLYSGTASAALEGAICGVPSIAVSLVGRSRHFLYAARMTQRLVSIWQARGFSPRGMLNMNVPDRPEAEIRGFCLARMGVRRYANAFERRVDPHGRDYYWLAGEPVDEGAADSDIVRIREGYVTVVPIGFDLTDTAALAAWGGTDALLD